MMIDAPKAAPVTVVLSRKAATQVSESPFDYVGGVFVHPGKRWLASIQWAKGDAEAGADSGGFLSDLNGQENTFPMGPLEKRLGVGGGVPVIALADQKGSSFQSGGWTPSTDRVLAKGDFVSILDRLYQVRADVDSDVGGLAAIKVWPNVRVAPALNTPIIIDAPKGEFRQARNESPSPHRMLGGATSGFQLLAESIV